jgi:CDP-glycerol glycerophosphotransferase
VIDVTDYPEIADLCLASDAAILDYSSLRFDYALTGKPMVFLVPDLVAYRDDARGWLMPYEPTAPGPLVHDAADAVEWLTRLDDLSSQFAPDRERFLADFMPLEDGRAACRAVDAIFGAV